MEVHTGTHRPERSESLVLAELRRTVQTERSVQQIHVVVRIVKRSQHT